MTENRHLRVHELHPEAREPGNARDEYAHPAEQFFCAVGLVKEQQPDRAAFVLHQHSQHRFAGRPGTDLNFGDFANHGRWLPLAQLPDRPEFVGIFVSPGEKEQRLASAADTESIQQGAAHRPRPRNELDGRRVNQLRRRGRDWY